MSDSLPGGKDTSLGAGWLLGLALFGLGLIFYGTLFPFDFIFDGHTWWQSLATFDRNLIRRDALMDFPVNVLLFMPLGAALGGLFRSARRNFFLGLALAFLLGTATSLLVEILQTYLAVRFSSYADVVANGLGAVLGYVAGFWLLEMLWGRLLSLSARLHIRLPRPVLALLALAYLGWFAWGFLALRSDARLSNWDPGYYLVLGNEYSGDRPWSGRLDWLVISAQAMDPQAVAAAFTSGAPLDNDGVVAAYRFIGPTDVQRLAGPQLVWQGTPSAGGRPGSMVLANSATLSGSGWLQSTVPASAMSQAIAYTSAFTLDVRLYSDGAVQSGPARIVSLSVDPYRRNLTLGQEGQDLIVRLRTPATGENGLRPELVVPDVFVRPGWQRLFITYDGSALQVYVDRVENHSFFSFSPAVLLFWRFPPREADQMRPVVLSFWIFQALFMGLLVLPPVVLLALAVRQGRHHPKNVKGNV